MIILKKQQLEASTIIAPKNDARYYLNSVLIEINFENAAYIVATNGSILFVGEIDCPDFTIEPKTTRLVIPRSTIEQVLRVKDKNQTIELKRSGEGWQLGSVLFQPLDSDRFPNWRRVNVSPGDINAGSPEPAQYNPELLLVAHKSLSKWSVKKGGPAMLHQRGNEAGVLVNPADNSAHVIVMPWRADTTALPRVVKPF